MAETLLTNSGPDKTSAICYAVGWTQHTNGVQMIRRGGDRCSSCWATSAGPAAASSPCAATPPSRARTDIATLYHSIHGYMTTPVGPEPRTTR